MFSTFGYHDHTFFIRSKLFSDFGAHIPLIRSFSAGFNFPIEYPTFPEAPIRYHFLFYAIVAGLESLGLNLGLSMNLLSFIGFTLLLSFIYLYGRLIFRRRLAGIIALILFLFNGSLSFIYFFQEHPLSWYTLADIISAPHFASFGPWDGKLVAAFWNLNIYTNQRHLGLSLGLSLLLLYPLIRALYRRQKPKVWENLGMCGVMLFLPWLHQAAAIMVLMMSGLILLFNFKNLRFYWPTYLLLLVSALPGLAYYASLNGSHLSYHLGFLARQTDFPSLLKYWFYNLGLYLPLFVVLLFWLDRPGRSVLLAAFFIFLFANLVRLSPDIINNHKLVNFFVLVESIYISGWLVSLWTRRRGYRFLSVVFLFSLTLSGFIDFFPIVNDTSISILDIKKNPASFWIAENTPKTAVFLTTAYMYNPASLAGRKTFLDYGYFNWSMGYDEHSRREALPQIFAPDTTAPALCRLLQDFKIDYVYLESGHGDLADYSPQTSFLARQFSPIYSAPNGSRIYSVSENCN